MRRFNRVGSLVLLTLAVPAANLSLSAGDRVPETKHVTAKDRNLTRTVAMASDLFIALVLAAYLVLSLVA